MFFAMDLGVERIFFDRDDLASREITDLDIFDHWFGWSWRSDWLGIDRVTAILDHSVLEITRRVEHYKRLE